MDIIDRVWEKFSRILQQHCHQHAQQPVQQAHLPTHINRVMVLLPYTQTLPQAQRAWAQSQWAAQTGAPTAYAPRFATAQSWAETLPPLWAGADYLAQPMAATTAAAANTRQNSKQNTKTSSNTPSDPWDYQGEMAIDLLSAERYLQWAQTQLTQAQSKSKPQASTEDNTLSAALAPFSNATMAAQLLAIAQSLAPLAAAQTPTERPRWAAQMQAFLAANAAPWALLESALQTIALQWLGDSRFATDALFAPPLLQQIDAIAFVHGYQTDPLNTALAHHFSAHGIPVWSYTWHELTQQTRHPQRDHCNSSNNGTTTPTAWPTSLRLFSAKDAEQEAQWAAACVLEHLQRLQPSQPSQARPASPTPSPSLTAPIALIAQDRLLARRAGAMLTQCGLAVRDETGWQLSTTHAAARIMALLRAAAEPADCNTVWNWLKLAPAFAAPGGAQETQLQTHERRWRRQGQQNWAACAATLPEIETLRTRLQAPRSLYQWQQDLRLSLIDDGQWELLAKDAAGQDCIHALYLDRAEYANMLPGTGKLSLAQWTQWVQRVLEAARFRPPLPEDTAPQVLILPLVHLLGQPFSAIVFAGCDAQSLPILPPSPIWWSPAQRATLGLPSSEDLCQTHRAHWLGMLERAEHGLPLDLLYRRSENGEQRDPSPLLQEWALTQGHDLTAHAQRTAPWPQLRPPPANPANAAQRTPLAVQAQGLPITQISPSAYTALRNCPYQFYAHKLLGLAQLDEFDAERQYLNWGNWVHSVLRNFHEKQKNQALPRHTATAPNATHTGLQLALDQAAENSLKTMGIHSADALPYLARWPQLRDAYIHWLVTEQNGSGAADHAPAMAWEFYCAETELRLTLDPSPGQAALTLHGKIDRIDRIEKNTAPAAATPAHHSALRIIDYKAESEDKTKQRGKNTGEEVQLSFYTALALRQTQGVLGLQPSQVQAAYLGLSETGCHLETLHDAANQADKLLVHIQNDIDRIHHGQTLRPLGQGSTCSHCAARGLCRKDWVD